MWNNIIWSYFRDFKMEINFWHSITIFYNDNEFNFDWNEITFEKITDYSSEQSFYWKLNENIEKFKLNNNIDKDWNIKLILDNVFWLKILKYQKEQEFIDTLLSEWFHFWTEENVLNFILNSCEQNNNYWEFSIVEDDEWSWCNFSIDVWWTIEELYDSQVEDDEYEDDDNETQFFVDKQTKNTFNLLNTISSWKEISWKNELYEKFKNEFNSIWKNNFWILTFENWWMKDIESIETKIWLNNTIDLNNFIIFWEEQYKLLSKSFLWNYMKLWKEWVKKLKENIWNTMYDIRELILNIL